VDTALRLESGSAIQEIRALTLAHLWEAAPEAWGVGALCLTTFRGHTGTLQILRSIRVHSRVLVFLILASGGRVVAPSRPYLMLFRS
jgi:hypothetical protein